MIRPELLSRVMKHEGFESKPYKDTTGHLTIGYGRNLDDVGITEAEAAELLENDLSNARVQCFAMFAEFFADLSHNRQDVLIEMMFNLGWRKLKGFQKMRLALERRNYEMAADEMLNSLWAKQVGQRAETLADLMRKG